jgi:hypothetical protein
MTVSGSVEIWCEILSSHGGPLAVGTDYGKRDQVAGLPDRNPRIISPAQPGLLSALCQPFYDCCCPAS